MWVAMSRGTAVGVLAATFVVGGAAGWWLRGGPATHADTPALTALPPGAMPPSRDAGREPARATVPPLARVQGRVFDDRREEEPGKIPHEIPNGVRDRARLELRKRGRWGFPYFGGIDQTAWWVRLVDAYATATGDHDLVDEARPNLEAAARWMAGAMRSML